jgi:hypothetical protein
MAAARAAGICGVPLEQMFDLLRGQYEVGLRTGGPPN